MKRIKKNLIFLFFIMLLMPLTMQIVYAEPTCSEINDKVDQYYTIEEEMESLECSKSTDASIIKRCNTLDQKRIMLLTDIYEINDMDIDCDKTGVSDIINDNKGLCTNELSSRVNSFAKLMLNNFYIIGTILFIIFGSLDFFKNVASSDQKDLKKNRANFFKRLTALFLLYILPVLINLIFMVLPYHYRLGTNRYVCSSESYYVSSDEVVSGYYSKSGIGITVYGGSTASGRAIAEAAKEIKQTAVNNGYTYGCNGASASIQGTNKLSTMCCAELIGASLLKAGIYTESEVASIQSASAPTTTRNLVAKGFKAIWDEKQLQPGDILIYKKFTDLDGCGTATIEGTTYHVPHVDIYYGNGKKISTGGAWSTVVSDFSTDDFYTQGGYAHWLCGLRYVGK